MDKREDGGPASPGEAAGMHGPNQGMTLRDWFAGQALAGLKANTDASGSYQDFAAYAYAYADSMLAARKVR